MSFSAEWLALREPVDHASRNGTLADDVTAHFAGRNPLRVVDLGCGTGSNLRASVRRLPVLQDWLLVDYDPALLAAARQSLRSWATTAREEGETLVIAKAGRIIRVSFRQADLTADLERVLDERPDLVTASALFDLTSAPFMQRFARVVAAAGAAFYTVLTYDGRDAFAPPHPLDRAVIEAFAAHQRGDKGFGPAAGPDSAAALAEAFRSAGYRVAEADSPWRIDDRHPALAGQLLDGIAAAVAETGRIDAAGLATWLAFRQQHRRDPDGLIVTGHRDTFAVPATA